MKELLRRYHADDACAARLLCDDHQEDHVAFTIVGPDLGARHLTYGELEEKSKRCAVALAELGVRSGDEVATLMAQASVEFIIAALGIWRRGAICLPLPTSANPAEVGTRLANSSTKVVITDSRRRARLGITQGASAFAPWQVIVSDRPGIGEDLSMDVLLKSCSPLDPRAEAVAVGGDGVLARLPATNAAGAPTTYSVPAKALAGFCAYLTYGIGLPPTEFTEDSSSPSERSDVYWCDSEADSYYGFYYGILGPLAAGRRNILLRSEDRLHLAGRLVLRFGVTHIATTTAGYGSIARQPRHVLAHVRDIIVAGDSFDAVAQRRRIPHVVVSGHYGTREHGMVIVNGMRGDVWSSTATDPVAYPMTGWSIAVLHEDRDHPVRRGERGRLAIDAESSHLFWFGGYDKSDSGNSSANRHWYLTGDTDVRVEDEDHVLFMSSATNACPRRA